MTRSARSRSLRSLQRYKWRSVRQWKFRLDHGLLTPNGEQVSKQAKDAVRHITVMIKEGTLDPKPIRASIEVVGITLHPKKPY